MKQAYLTHPSYSRHEMGEYHPECPQRIDRIHDRLLAKGLLDLMAGFDPPVATREQLLRAHTAQMIDRLEASSPNEGLAAIDPDTSMNPFTLEAAHHAAGAGVLAAELVVKQGFERVFCNVRPPGHHAERNRPMGFCFYNNIAIGALHALDVLGLERVAVIDFDVHHGNGTEDILHDDPRVLMVSTFERGLYPNTGLEPRGTNMRNVPLDAYSDGRALRMACDQTWVPALMAFEPQLLFVSAGFDAHREDELSYLMWDDADYAWISQRLVQVANDLGHRRVISMLEGGYALPALARCAELHVRALLEI